MLTDDVWCYVRALCNYVIHGYYALKKVHNFESVHGISPRVSGLYNLKSFKVTK